MDTASVRVVTTWDFALHGDLYLRTLMSAASGCNYSCPAHDLVSGTWRVGGLSNWLF